MYWNYRKLLPCLFFLIFAGTACSPVKNSDQEGIPSSFVSLDTLVQQKNFQLDTNGKSTDLYILKNSSGIIVKLTNFGARIVSILMPDSSGVFADITQGYSSIREYMTDNMYQGATVGRYANRIADAKFKLEGKKFILAKNNGENSLHGGVKGFSRVIWDGRQEGNRVHFSYISPDMEDGYPGTVRVQVSYSLNDSNRLTIEYRATTDKPTVINLTNHSYFNLSGERDSSILDQILYINANYFLPVGSSLIPTGKIQQVANTPMDFTENTLIGSRIEDTFEQIQNGKGYDHCWVLNKKGNELSLAARIIDPNSGRALELWTTEPGMQFYSGNFMDGSVTGKSGKPYLYRSGLALEPQHFPDSPNQPDFPDVSLRPGEEYKQTSVFVLYPSFPQ